MISTNPAREYAVLKRISRPAAFEVGRGLLGTVATVCVAIAAFLLHLNLASAISILLLITVIAAIRWGLVYATAISLTAVGCLDYFFTTPLFEFSVRSPENWVALATFEATALLVSRLSWQVKLHAQEQELQRQKISKLYQLSNAILLVDGRTETVEQLCALLREIFAVDSAEIWVAPEGVAPVPEHPARHAGQRAYLEGNDSDSPQNGWSQRMLRLGTSAIGAMVLQGWEVDPSLADAAASLIAVALERARSVQKENRAEAARNTEQLRTAVLDALAHGFKTPLTAIQTASSGLLAIGRLDGTQKELVEIIDHEVSMLARLTTRLLQTAALDASEIRVRSSMVSLREVVEDVVGEQDLPTRRRIVVREESPLDDVRADRPLLAIALSQLIDNAVKYSDVDSRIDVTLTQDTVKTTVVVSNQGSPVLPRDRGRIFDRYYRGAYASRGPSGTGLGLSIAKKIVEAHGGSIAATDEGERTSFSFSLQGGRKDAHGEA
jgi:two-component system sensor histidine kinase KdpD